MLIRQANVNDVEIIRQLAEDIWWPNYSPIISAEQISFMLSDRYSSEVLREQIEQKEQTYLLTLDGVRPVGFAAYGPTDDDAIYRLHKLYCLPSTHGKGFGKALLNRVIAQVKQLGATTLELNVHRLNPAKTFYDKMGFEIAYEIDIPMGDYFLNDYVMRKQLT
ncbi:GNAT family N-acetyltransferase [Mucilaginibacter auburnensis]|uniref:Ribosomal protein S18 acetylase RimI-like enzyme n=1 Tax=Mucilaginibacter auburnensis TaxID=1457233 RepID=A0A2H9VSC6_9SPHI|nr:GNAT family N-acetyltransferase [Mucilaginibacter auburnensis]PJJ83715.1 ribosomal protein S18 acetylase RimI-like enzyme [Mucilaginibacter auburnensis]